MSMPLALSLRFETMECCNCGVLFAISNELQDNFRKTKKSFYCPNGHSQSYTENEADRLRRQLEAAQRDVEWQKNRAATAERRATKAERAHRVLKRRVNHGVCPHCSRTVSQLARHIKSKHPDQVVADKGGLPS
jgi:Zn finger protein HypA/HybF involved in hydrogenase expression